MSFWHDIIPELIAIKYLQADRKRAERLVMETFPGCHIRKIRKDAGIKKLTERQIVNAIHRSSS